VDHREEGEGGFERESKLVSFPDSLMHNRFGISFKVGLFFILGAEIGVLVLY